MEHNNLLAIHTKSVIIVVDALFHGVILLEILIEVNQNMEGYDHYSYLFPFPGSSGKSLDNRNHMNQKYPNLRYFGVCFAEQVKDV